MIIDERIKAVRNSAAAGGFGIVYSLLLIDLLYRQLYLRQSPGNWWDIFMMWFVSSLYVGINVYSSGMMSDKVGQQFKVMIPCIFVSIIASFYFTGKITSMLDLLGVILGIVPSLFAVFLFYYYLNRRWEKKNELDELE